MLLVVRVWRLAHLVWLVGVQLKGWCWNGRRVWEVSPTVLTCAEAWGVVWVWIWIWIWLLMTRHARGLYSVDTTILILHHLCLAMAEGWAVAV